MKSHLIMAVLATLLLGGCLKELELSDDGRSVKTGRYDPPSSLEEIGRVEASHGSDECGGSRGSYVVAENLLRNRAAEMGASYVKIVETDRPHTDDECVHNKWTIRGVAYRGELERVPPPTAGGEDLASPPPGDDETPDPTPAPPPTTDDVAPPPAATSTSEEPPPPPPAAAEEEESASTEDRQPR